MREVESYVMVAGTAVPSGAFSSNLIVDCWTASLNVAVTLDAGGIPVAFGAGERPVSVGAVASAVVVNVQLIGFIAFPAASLAPLPRAVYVALSAKGRVGVSRAVRDVSS